jgi:hypothetical protein
MSNVYPNWYGYLQFLQAQVGLPPQVLSPNLFTSILVDANGNPVIDANGNWISTSGAWGIVTDSGGNNLVDSSGNPVTGSVPYQWVLASFLIAIDLVNCDLPCGMYAFAVYNLAADRLINISPDQTGQSYWQELRKNFKIYDVSVGVAASGSDQGTAVSILNPEMMQHLTLFDLQTLKTPYGRAYMGMAQNYGPNIWGLS